MLRKQWFKHGDDPFVIYPPKGQPQELGLLPTPMGCITVRPGDWICIDDAGKRSIETDPTVLSDLTPAVGRALNYFHERSEEYDAALKRS